MKYGLHKLAIFAVFEPKCVEITVFADFLKAISQE
jgi:hypothetical protein